MFDINMVALIVLLNEPQTRMDELVPGPANWGGWRPGAVVVALAVVGIALALL